MQAAYEGVLTVTFSERSGRSVGFVMKAPPAGVRALQTADVMARRFRLWSAVTALVLGGVLLVLMAADVPLAGRPLARRGPGRCRPP